MELVRSLNYRVGKSSVLRVFSFEGNELAIALFSKWLLGRNLPNYFTFSNLCDYLNILPKSAIIQFERVDKVGDNKLIFYSFCTITSGILSDRIESILSKTFNAEKIHSYIIHGNHDYIHRFIKNYSNGEPQEMITLESIKTPLSDFPDRNTLLSRVNEIIKETEYGEANII